MSRFKVNYGRGAPDYIDADQYKRVGDLISFYRGTDVVGTVYIKDMRSISKVDDDEGKQLGFGFA